MNDVMSSRIYLYCCALAALCLIGVSCSGTSLREGAASLEGIVLLEGSDDHSDILVGIPATGDEVFTLSDGYYTFTGIDEGTYCIEYSRADYGRRTVAGVQAMSNVTTVIDSLTLLRDREIEGTIDASDRWDSYRRYIVSGELTVAAGCTLAIPCGVTVMFDGYIPFSVRGSLIASAAEGEEEILFTIGDGLSEEAEWKGIEIAGFDPGRILQLEGCRITRAFRGVYCLAGDLSLTVSRCAIEDCGYAGLLTGSAEVEVTDTIVRNAEVGILSEYGGALRITGCSIDSCHTSGLELNDSQGEVKDCRFTGCDYGIVCQFWSELAVSHNSFSNCRIGIYSYKYSTPEVEWNVFENLEETGIMCVVGASQDTSSAHFNNFIDIDNYAIFFRNQSTDMDATENWWGASEESFIITTIWDGNDETNNQNEKAFVLYSPWAVEPFEEAGPRD
jgi:hypothetical protein